MIEATNSQRHSSIQGAAIAEIVLKMIQRCTLASPYPHIDVRAVLTAHHSKLAVGHVLAMRQTNGSIVPRTRLQRQA